jgi:hypothetical protein
VSPVTPPPARRTPAHSAPDGSPAWRTSWISLHVIVWTTPPHMGGGRTATGGRLEQRWVCQDVVPGGYGSVWNQRSPDGWRRRGSGRLPGPTPGNPSLVVRENTTSWGQARPDRRLGCGYPRRHSACGGGSDRARRGHAVRTTGATGGGTQRKARYSGRRGALFVPRRSFRRVGSEKEARGVPCPPRAREPEVSGSSRSQRGVATSQP